MLGKVFEEGISVILLPPGELGSKIFKIAQEWTSHRLLKPAVYLKYEDQLGAEIQSNQDSNSIDFVGQVIAINGLRPCSIFELFARVNAKTVRVVAIRDCTGNSDEDNRAQFVLTKFREQTENGAMLKGVSEEDQGIRLLLLNLLVASSRDSLESHSSKWESSWGYNIWVVPEDRHRSAGFDSYMTSESPRFPGHILMNVATMAGLWTGIDNSIYDSEEEKYSESALILQRSFVRIVKTDEVAHKVAASALRNIQNHGHPLNDPSVPKGELKLVDESLINQVIDNFVDSTVKRDDSTLQCRIEDRADLQGAKKGIALTETLKLFGQFFLINLIELPRNLYASIIEWFNGKATDLFFGKDGSFEVDLRKEGKASKGLLRRFGLLEEQRNDVLSITSEKRIIEDSFVATKRDSGKRSEHEDLWSFVWEESAKLLEGTSKITGAEKSFLSDARYMFPKDGDSWTIPDFTLEEGEFSESIDSKIDWLDMEAASKQSVKFEKDIKDARDQYEKAQVNLRDAEGKKESAKSWTRKARLKLESSRRRESFYKDLV